MFWKRKYMSVRSDRHNDAVQWCSGVFTVPGVRFTQSPVVSTKQAAPSHFWNGSHFFSPPLSSFSLLPISKIEPRCFGDPPLPPSFLSPFWLVLSPLCHCRKLRWDQEKANPPSCGEGDSLLGHLDSILFPLDVILLSCCFAIKQ